MEARWWLRSACSPPMRLCLSIHGTAGTGRRSSPRPGARAARGRRRGAGISAPPREPIGCSWRPAGSRPDREPRPRNRRHQASPDPDHEAAHRRRRPLPLAPTQPLRSRRPSEARPPSPPPRARAHRCAAAYHPSTCPSRAASEIVAGALVDRDANLRHQRHSQHRQPAGHGRRQPDLDSSAGADELISGDFMPAGLGQQLSRRRHPHIAEVTRRLVVGSNTVARTDSS